MNGYISAKLQKNRTDMIFNKIRTISLLLAISFSTMLSAQVVKEIAVSQKESYTDHLSLKKDTRDMDLMVKFVFNEEANTLTVSLISYRCLFVFFGSASPKPSRSHCHVPAGSMCSTVGTLTTACSPCRKTTSS